jgi:hypothetical protein
MISSLADLRFLGAVFVLSYSSREAFLDFSCASKNARCRYCAPQRKEGELRGERRGHTPKIKKTFNDL